MHEVFKIKSSKPIPKFYKNLFDFEKPKILQKSQKLRFQNMKMHENERIEAYQVKKNLINLEECLRKRLDVKERVFGRWIGADRSREIKEMRIGSRKAYI